MKFIAKGAIEVAWLAFFVYWFLSALHVKKMKTKEPVWQRLGYVFGMVLAILLLDALAPRGFFRWRFIPRAPWVAFLAAVLTVAGVAFAIWARAHIGEYWSATVALREGHQLIRTGPYAHIRHPIYSGALLALAGTCIYWGNYQAIVFFAVVLAGFTMKARKEEALLAGEFGPAFEEHRRHTGFFLPKFS